MYWWFSKSSSVNFCLTLIVVFSISFCMWHKLPCFLCPLYVCKVYRLCAFVRKSVINNKYNIEMKLCHFLWPSSTLCCSLNMLYIKLLNRQHNHHQHHHHHHHHCRRHVKYNRHNAREFFLNWLFDFGYWTVYFCQYLYLFFSLTNSVIASTKQQQQKNCRKVLFGVFFFSVFFAYIQIVLHG